MGTHLIDGEFQSDKYPSTPRGKVPLSCKDRAAQDLLWEYAQRRRQVDGEFSDDLEEALRLAGYARSRPLPGAQQDAMLSLLQKEGLNEHEARIAKIALHSVGSVERSNAYYTYCYELYARVCELQVSDDETQAADEALRDAGVEPVGTTLPKAITDLAEAWRDIPPHDLILFCPECGAQHLDIGEFLTRPHRKHLCENTPLGPKTGCGHEWKPYPYATRGVPITDHALMLSFRHALELEIKRRETAEAALASTKRLLGALTDLEALGKVIERSKAFDPPSTEALDELYRLAKLEFADVFVPNVEKAVEALKLAKRASSTASSTGDAHTMRCLLEHGILDALSYLTPGKATTMYLCTEHGGHGFVSDCTHASHAQLEETSWLCLACSVRNTGPHYGVATECGHCGEPRPAAAP